MIKLISQELYYHGIKKAIQFRFMILGCELAKISWNLGNPDLHQRRETPPFRRIQRAGIAIFTPRLTEGK